MVRSFQVAFRVVPIFLVAVVAGLAIDDAVAADAPSKAGTAPAVTVPAVGDTVPRFGAPDLDGRGFNVSRLLAEIPDQSGCAALVFFTTVCQPCKREIMAMSAASDRLVSAGVRVVLVAAGETVGKVRPFLERAGVSFRTVTDKSMDISRMFGLTTPQMTVTVPRTFIFGVDGVIRGVIAEPGPDIVDVVISSCRAGSAVPSPPPAVSGTSSVN